MKNLGHIGPETTEEDCEVEIIDLDPPDDTGGSTSSWLASALLQWQRSPNGQRYRRYWRLTCALCIVLFIVTLFSLIHMSSLFIEHSFKTALYPSSHAPSLTTLPAPPLPPQDGIACLADAAWSPDGTSIAVLGYQDCSRSDYVLGLVNLYNARSKQLAHQLQPDKAILRVLSRPLPSSQGRAQHGNQPPPGRTGGDTAPFISYEHVIWSPDGRRLAVTFEPAAQQSPVQDAVLMNRDGGNVEALRQQQQVAPPLYTEWDLDQSASNSPSAHAPRVSPPALAYHWGANGTLRPQGLLTAPAVPAIPPPGPIGNPDGDHSFTIWQPALAHAILFADASGTYSVYTWRTNFAAWSPDGRYLVEGLGLSGPLAPPDRPFPSRKVLQAFNLDQAPILPMRDTAMFEVIESASMNGTDTALTLAWSPNGRVLAAYRAGNTVALYNSTNGHKLASFALPGKSAAPPADAVALRWSPDGSHLLLSSVSWGLIALWSL